MYIYKCCILPKINNEYDDFGHFFIFIWQLSLHIT